MLDGLSPTTAILAVFTYPAYLLTMAGVLGACGVPRKEIAKWVLRRADRQHLTDLVRSLRRGPADQPDGRSKQEIDNRATSEGDG
jgi:hypothetical protein